jgi:hypothetical protein
MRAWSRSRHRQEHSACGLLEQHCSLADRFIFALWQKLLLAFLLSVSDYCSVLSFVPPSAFQRKAGISIKWSRFWRAVDSREDGDGDDLSQHSAAPRRI